MRIEDFIECVTHIIEQEIPPILLKDLNMGVYVSPRLLEDDLENDYYIMGEYIQTELGNQIILYYGSFQYFHKNDPENVWRKEILDTIKHELLHHVEAMAGQEDLALQEEIEMYHRKKKTQK